VEQARARSRRQLIQLTTPAFGAAAAAAAATGASPSGQALVVADPPLLCLSDKNQGLHLGTSSWCNNKQTRRSHCLPMQDKTKLEISKRNGHMWPFLLLISNFVLSCIGRQ